MRDSAQRPAGEDCGRYRLSTILLLCAVVMRSILRQVQLGYNPGVRMDKSRELK